MVAGRLQEKNGFYYIVLSYTDSAGKRRQPWIGTGLPVKGNKKRAEKILAETRKSFTIPKGQVSELSPDMAFSDYMRYWLKMMRTAVTETTYSSYCFNVEKHIIPYFEPLGVTLAGLQPRQIQSFYLHEAETLKNTSILYKNSFFLDASKRFDNSSPEFVELINGTIGMRKSKNFVRSSFEKISSLTA